MEIERKWMVPGWPEGAVPTRVFQMDQGYIALRPTVRIRREAEGAAVRHVLCFKGRADAAGLAREEIETDLSPELFARLEGLIGLPLIQKEQRRYPLAGGLTLEVNRVDGGQPGEFFYAEVEFPTREAALAWAPQSPWADYLSREVTGQPGQSMADYWLATRGHAGGVDAPEKWKYQE